MMVFSILASMSKPPDPFHPPDLEVFQTSCLVGDSWPTWELFGLSGDPCFDRVVLYMVLSVVIVGGLFIAAFRRPELVPRGLQNLMESIVEFVRNGIAVEVIGPDGTRFVPFLTTLFMFILVNNIFGIIPGIQFPVNSRIALPALMAVVVYVVFNYVGIRAQGLGNYLKRSLFPPGVPLWMLPLVTPIELVSTFLLRPFTLAVRLFANMVAGHLILAIFFLGTWYLQWKLATLPFAAMSFALGTAMVGFEVLVAVLQAYIFTILTAVYISGALHPEH